MHLAAILAGGVLYALALPPFDWAVCGWVALAPLITVVRGRTPVSAFRYGLIFGYAYGWAVSWPFAEAAARYFELSLPVAVATMCAWYLAVCGLPCALFAAGTVLLQRSRGRAVPLLGIPALWVATELLRGRILGQPWGLLGYTQHAQLGLIQVATFTGVYGVSFLLALGATALAEGILAVRTTHRLRSAVGAIAGPAAAVALCWVGGLLSAANPPIAKPEGHTVAVVQTNVSPALHWTRSYTERQIAAHIRATSALLAESKPALVVWPENSVPRYLEAEPFLRARIAGIARGHATDILFGAPRYADGRVFNSAHLITASGRDGGHYDKQRLVPFAEEKPFSPSAGAVPSASPDSFSPGNSPGVLQSFVRLGVSICHEIVHPDLVDVTALGGAELLVNISNDGWLDGGYGFATRQHLAMAVFRAVEARRYLVRAATTGPSAVVSPYGEVIAVLGAGSAGLLTATVTGNTGLTPYVRFGDVFAFLCVCLAAGVLLWRPLPVATGLRGAARAGAAL